MRFVLLFVLLSLALDTTAATGRVFVSNEKGNSVSVIDSKTNKIIKTIAVGKRPRGVGLAPDGSAVYVAISGENHIAVINPNSLELSGQFPSGDDPEAFAIHKNGNLYISNENDAKASVYDPHTGKLVAEIEVGIEPEGVAISPDGTRAIVTSESTNMLHIIAIPEHTVINSILVGARPRSATFSADGKLAYATSEIGGEVKKVDVASGTILGKVALSDDQAKPKDILVSRDGKHLYVANRGSNTVHGKSKGKGSISVIDFATGKVIKNWPIPGGGSPDMGNLSADGKYLWLSGRYDDEVYRIETTTGGVDKIKVGREPHGLTVWPQPGRYSLGHTGNLR